MESSLLLDKVPDLIGSKVTVSIVAGLYKGEYASRLEDGAEDVWKLAHPLLGGGLIPLYRGVELKLSVHADGIVYHVDGAVLGTVRDGVVPLLVVRLTGRAEKVQRRRFLRVSCVLEAKMTALRSPGELSSPWIKAVIHDLSLGGVRLFVKDDEAALYDEEDRVILRLCVDDEPLYLPAHVVSKRREDDQVGTSLGLVFDFLPAMVERVLGAFVRKRELALRNERR